MLDLMCLTSCVPNVIQNVPENPFESMEEFYSRDFNQISMQNIFNKRMCFIFAPKIAK